MLEIIDYRPMNGVRKASFTLRNHKSHREDFDCGWYEHNGKRWFSHATVQYEKEGQKKFRKTSRMFPPDLEQKFHEAFFLVLEKFLLDNPDLRVNQPQVSTTENMQTESDVPF